MALERNPKRSKSLIINNGSKQLKPNPMADCVLPDDIMMIILLRLPVKSLLRFKAVCSSWLKTFAAPKFIKAHHHFSGKTPPAKITYHHPHYYLVHTMYVFTIESSDETPIDFDHPIFFRMNYVGCCGGLICLGLPPLGQVILLWNPAMKLYKFLPLSNVDFGVPVMFSLGFGYDEEAGDFKVVRVVYVKGEKIRAEVEVYSSLLDTWETIKLDFQFQVFSTRNTAVVDGNPFWLAKIGESQGGIDNCFMVWFDVREMVFKRASVASIEAKDEKQKDPHILLPFASFEIENGNHIPLVDQKFSVLVFGEDNSDRPVPVELKLQCSKNGKIMEFCLNGKVFVFDPKKGWVMEIPTEKGEMGSSEVDGYCESLARVKGMKPVVMNKQEDNN